MRHQLTESQQQFVDWLANYANYDVSINVRRYATAVHGDREIHPDRVRPSNETVEISGEISYSEQCSDHAKCKHSHWVSLRIDAEWKDDRFVSVKLNRHRLRRAQSLNRFMDHVDAKLASVPRFKSIKPVR